MFAVFVFKQKTAYEMRISDWSSDVCSSDLAALCLGKRVCVPSRFARAGWARVKPRNRESRRPAHFSTHRRNLEAPGSQCFLMRGCRKGHLWEDRKSVV